MRDIIFSDILFSLFFALLIEHYFFRIIVNIIFSQAFNHLFVTLFTLKENVTKRIKELFQLDLKSFLFFKNKPCSSI